MADHEEITEAEVRLAWPPFDEGTILFADQILLSYRSNHCVLTVGQVADPIIPGGSTDAVEKLRAGGTIPIKVLARFGMTKHVWNEFLDSVVSLRERMSDRGVDASDEVDKA